MSIRSELTGKVRWVLGLPAGFVPVKSLNSLHRRAGALPHQPTSTLQPPRCFCGPTMAPNRALSEPELAPSMRRRLNLTHPMMIQPASVSLAKTIVNVSTLIQQQMTQAFSMFCSFPVAAELAKG